jgi:uncharacterized protein involved in outer membrane biogenesis
VKFIQDTIEKKLSELLGRQVTFERLNVSPLSGQVEAEGMTIAGDAGDKPLLSVARIGAKVAVAKALAGQIVIKSMTIEGPVLRIPRLGDGSFKIPPRANSSAAQERNGAGGWHVEAESVQLIDGSVFLGDAGSSAAARQINGQLKLSAERRAEVELRGSVDAARWLAALPPAIALSPAFSAWKFNGLAEVDVRLDAGIAEGVHIRELKVRAVDVGVPLNFFSKPGDEAIIQRD